MTMRRLAGRRALGWDSPEWVAWIDPNDVVGISTIREEPMTLVVFRGGGSVLVKELTVDKVAEVLGFVQ